jgi:NDP-sugar pyrophosphorylase family protein
MITSAGIIAAGEGRRMKVDGVPFSKPLIPIGGTPLIGHTLRQFLEIGVKRVAIIFNETQQECADWVRAHFAPLELEILLKTTHSSSESFWRVGRALGPGRHVICTVDSICSPKDWQTMFASAADLEREVLLAVTSFVHDESPLWVSMEPASLKIVDLGAPRGEFATAGIYGVTAAIFEREWQDGISSLRAFLGQLLREGFPFRAVPLGDVIDVDTVADINLAERFLSRIRGDV